MCVCLCVVVVSLFGMHFFICLHDGVCVFLLCAIWVRRVCMCVLLCMVRPRWPYSLGFNTTHTPIHPYTHTYPHTHTHTQKRTHTCTHTYTHMHTHTYTHMHAHANTHTDTHRHICTHMQKDTPLCKWVNTHKHIHTHVKSCKWVTHTQQKDTPSCKWVKRWTPVGNPSSSQRLGTAKSTEVCVVVLLLGLLAAVMLLPAKRSGYV